MTANQWPKKFFDFPPIEDVPDFKHPRREKEKTIPWRESSKDLIGKYTETGLMLRGARFKANLTQRQLAEKIGVKPHHIGEMEHGKRAIDKDMAKRLAGVLGVDYRVFL